MGAPPDVLPCMLSCFAHAMARLSTDLNLLSACGVLCLHVNNVKPGAS